MLIDHIPKGNPCRVCGKSAFRHRVEHKPNGDPCTLCGMPVSRHRIRKRKQEKAAEVFMGIDGEGQGREIHKYVLLAASVETGSRSWWVSNPNGLPTEDCLEFMLNLPSHNTKVFAYAFNYDLTKMLADIDTETLYLLFRPELRARLGKDAIKGPYPVKWRGYRINLQGTKFTIAKGSRRRVIWDVFKFFQSKFVGALKDWKVGDNTMIERMTLMKDKRSEFDKESPDAVRAYCLEECRYMGELARKLVTAHGAVGLRLRSFYGAGSSASAMLDIMGIKDKIKKPPKEMNRAVASAFFGGRFENSVIGEVTGTVYNYDISSAYPYQLHKLPCLLHGWWELTTDRTKLTGGDTKAALVHYGLGPNPGITQWGPFPYRMPDGSISFPITSGGGWVWRDEFRMGAQLFPNVQFKEAWIYHCDCHCHPFQRIPEYYRERCRIGKEGPGIVLKLGTNSCYGKVAQSVGRGMYNSWVWAGLITSGTRAQILHMLGLHRDWANLLMIATDGIYTREKLVTPRPDDTNTWETGKPLGGWEEKIITKGVFVARPGIYFPMNPTKEEIKDVRGRGVGKSVVLENWKLIADSWKTHGVEESVQVANVTRFCGAKSTIHRSGNIGNYKYTRADGTNGPNSPSYGQWITRSVQLSFNPMPKRESLNPDGMTLKLREFPQTQESTPYSKAIKSQDAKMLAAAAQTMMEQPDGDLSDYEPDSDQS